MVRFSLAALAIACALRCQAQQPMTFQYFYDETGQLVRVVDSTGISIEYVYDAVGNMLEIKRSTIAVGRLTVLGIVPASGGPGATVVIQGLGFSSTPASNAVRFNGLSATVLSASATQLVVAVPLGATTGSVTVTVGSNTAASPASFTVVPVPVVTSVSRRAVVAGQSIPNFQAGGANFAGASFTLAPMFAPSHNIANVVVAPAGNAASMTLTVSPSAAGTLVLVATNATASSDLFPSAANSMVVLPASNADGDFDRLTNQQELTAGTDPLNPDTDGDGYSTASKSRWGRTRWTREARPRPRIPFAKLPGFVSPR